ncbi:MAG TPA: (d)CMP kinase [Thiomicrorhabdus sp.]|nr:(d)CMP kinase [Thiomicrorhabdus sp.]
MSLSIPVITIDGPSGVGKGTLAQFLVQQTGFHLLDSGAIYRVLALGAVQDGIALDDVTKLVALANALPVEFIGADIFYNKEDVTTKIRTEEIAGVASAIAVIPEIREALLARQKAFATMPGLIADGRDMGTVVFSTAQIKFYLTASAEIRAQRRVKQLKSQGVNANIDQITRDIEIRDERDLNRKTAPLKPAEDAIVMDTSHLDIDAVCQKALSLVKKQKMIA